MSRSRMRARCVWRSSRQCVNTARSLLFLPALLPLLLSCATPDPRCLPGQEKLSSFLDRWRVVDPDLEIRFTLFPVKFMQRYNAHGEKTDFKPPERIAVVTLAQHPMERWLFIHDNDCIINHEAARRGTFKKLEADTEGV